MVCTMAFVVILKYYALTFVNRIVDNLPGATAKREFQDGRKMYVAGFPLGQVQVSLTSC